MRLKFASSISFAPAKSYEKKTLVKTAQPLFTYVYVFFFVIANTFSRNLVSNIDERDLHSVHHEELFEARIRLKMVFATLLWRNAIVYFFSRRCILSFLTLSAFFLFLRRCTSHSWEIHSGWRWSCRYRECLDCRHASWRWNFRSISRGLRHVGLFGSWVNACNIFDLFLFGFRSRCWCSSHWLHCVLQRVLCSRYNLLLNDYRYWHFRKILEVLLRQVKLVLVQGQNLFNLIESFVNLVQLGLRHLGKRIQELRRVSDELVHECGCLLELHRRLT